MIVSYFSVWHQCRHTHSKHVMRRGGVSSRVGWLVGLSLIAALYDSVAVDV